MPVADVRPLIRAGVVVLIALVVAGCSIAKPRTDDPWEPFNRKVYAFNDALDRTAIRPLAVGYRKITTPKARSIISNFFENVRMPISIANDVLQGDPRAALHNTARFLINTTVGFAGLFDPASEMSLPPAYTDFGVTLAKWGVPEGPFLVVPFVGPNTVRDIWRLPVDGEFFDPLGAYGRHHDYTYKTQYLPSFMYLVTLRSRGLDADNLLEGIYDPYVFYRDAYRQRRLYEMYKGQPPASVLEDMQIGGNDDIDVDKLLEEQHRYERRQKEKNKGRDEDDN